MNKAMAEVGRMAGNVRSKVASHSKFLMLAALLLLSPVLTWAQTDPGAACADNDPLDNTCPLDSGTLLWILIAATLGFTLWHMAKQMAKKHSS